MRFSLALVQLALASVFPVSAATIMSKSDLRLWETVADRTLPLKWPWAYGADSATLVFSNRLTRVVSSVTVPRGAGETDGSCVQPAPSAGEDVVDVRLTQISGGNEIAGESATLAYVSGACGGPVTVRVRNTREWKRFLEPRVFAVDPAWEGLAGDSGYDIAWPNYRAVRIILR